MENITCDKFLAVLQQDNDNFLCVLPVELYDVEVIKEQLSMILQNDEACKSFSPAFKKCIVGILKKTEHRATQVRARNDYLAITARTLQTLNEEEDDEWRLLELQLISSPEKLLEEKNKILKEIAKLHKSKKKITEVFRQWQEVTAEEHLVHANFKDSISNGFVTEPLLHCQDLEDIINSHFAQNYYMNKGKGSLLDKLAMRLMKHTTVLDEITANTDALHGRMLLLLREQLAKVQLIIKPTPDPLLTEKLKSSLSKKLTLAGAIDARQTKIMLLPESSMVTSRASDVEDPGESENDAVQEENVASPRRELLRKLTLQETILMDSSDSVDREFIKDVIK